MKSALPHSTLSHRRRSSIANLSPSSHLSHSDALTGHTAVQTIEGGGASAPRGLALLRHGTRGVPPAKPDSWATECGLSMVLSPTLFTPFHLATSPQRCSLGAALSDDGNSLQAVEFHLAPAHQVSADRNGLGVPWWNSPGNVTYASGVRWKRGTSATVVNRAWSFRLACDAGDFCYRLMDALRIA